MTQAVLRPLALATVPLAFATGYLFHENQSTHQFDASLISPAWAQSASSAELPDLVEKILPGVVNISSTTVVHQRIYGWDDWTDFWGIPRSRQQTSLGSGFIIDTDGYVITNNHVIEGATEVLATLHDKNTYQAEVVGRDPKTDLALLLLKTEEGKTPPNLRPVPLANSDAARIAEPVFAVGNPFGLQHTVTTGIISAKNRTIGLGPFDNFLQTDASINPGNSGGPLFNLKGQVVGINTVIYSRTGQSGGLGFAIPANEASWIVPDLKRYGRVPRPWLGILGEAISPGLQRYYGLPTRNGVLVYNLVQGGPADRKGIRQGDIIVSVNGKPTDEPVDVERVIGKLKPTEKATLEIQRGRKRIKVTIPLKELPPKLDQLPAGII